jgi:fimbrial chaperone protein
MSSAIEKPALADRISLHRAGPARALLSIALAGCFIAQMGDSRAASLRVSPLGIDLAASSRAAAVTVANTASEPITLQVRVFKWSQVGGEDRLEPATDIAASPPAVTIPAAASYTLRVARPAATPAPSELAYRLLLDELPAPADPNAIQPGVRMVLRTSIPVFIADSKAAARLTWSVWQDQAGVHAQVINSGSRHAKVAGLTLQVGDGSAPIVFGSGLNGYVLAGNTRQFVVAGSGAQLKAGAPLLLTAKSDALDIRVPLNVAAR